MTMMKTLAVGLMLAGATPVLAQVAAPPAPPAAPGAPMMRGPDGMGGRHGGMKGHRFASMSEAGRATMREAMQAAGDRQADRAAVKAARDRMLTVLDADRLDTAALKRAMDDERAAANASRERGQAAMLAGFSKLSAADRKAFVADARSMKDRVEKRMRKWRSGRGRDGGKPPVPPAI